MEEVNSSENKKNNFKVLISKIREMSKTYKTILIIVAVVVLFDILLGMGFFCVKKLSAVKLYNTKENNSSEFIYLDSNAKSGGIKESGFASFKFSKNQLKVLQKFYESEGNESIVIRVQIKPTKKQEVLYTLPPQLSLKYGFLTEEDFTSKDKFIPLKKYENKKVNVFADLKKLNQIDVNVVDLSLAISKEDFAQNSIPKGLYIYSDINCKIKNICIAPAVLGFDHSKEVSFYGFSSNGGVVDVSNSSVDFSNAKMVFSTNPGDKVMLPQIFINISDDENLKSTLEEAIFTKLNVGGEQIFVKNVKNASQIVIPWGALKTPNVLVELSENKECIKGIYMSQMGADKNVSYIPIRTDPGLILKYKTETWRNSDFEVFEWDRYPEILFFDTRNYDVQAKFFSRMAYFVEKEGFKGKILTNSELNGKHGYNAHDYRAESMADFFNAADAKGINLNEEEEILRKILLEKGILIKDGNQVKAGVGGLVSISQESAEYLRNQLLAHEGWHTLFFIDEEFRNYVAAVYYTMDSQTRDFLIDYFKSQPSLGYDTNDDYLMNNEFMAYNMQQGIKNVSSYWVTRAKWPTVKKYTPELADYIVKTNAQGFEDAATMLNDFVFDRYGIICGNIALIRK